MNALKAVKNNNYRAHKIEIDETAINKCNMQYCVTRI